LRCRIGESPQSRRARVDQKDVQNIQTRKWRVVPRLFQRDRNALGLGETVEYGATTNRRDGEQKDSESECRGLKSVHRFIEDLGETGLLCEV